jgi:hypothetical protein
MKSYVVALAVLVGILGGFYGGYKVGHSTVSASTNTATIRNTGGNNGGAAGGRALGAVCPTPGATTAAGTQSLARGTVTNLTGNSMTVTNTSCDVKITFGPTVTIQKQALGSTSDLQDNQTVTITGTRQPDGSLLAQTIQIGTAGGGGGRVPGGAAPSGSPGTGG